MRWGHVLRKLELKIRSMLLALIKGNFFCDGLNPWLCISCKRTREVFKANRPPNFIILLWPPHHVWNSLKGAKIIMVKVTAIGFVQLNTKIFDINEDDTEKHTCSMSANLPPNTVAIIVKASRATGTGSLYLYPNQGTDYLSLANNTHAVCGVIKNELQYKQSVANDDWNVFCLGYWTEGQIKK